MIENITLINNKSGAVLDLSMTETPYYVLDEVDWGQVPGDFQTYKYVNQPGVSVENVNLEPRPVAITGWVVAENKDQMTERKAVLNTFVNPQEEFTILYEDYKLKFHPDTSVKYSVGYEENNDTFVKFRIEGTAYNPLFFDKSETIEDGYDLYGMFHFPLIINKTQQDPPQIMFGWNKQAEYVNVLNSGQVDTGFKVIFKARGGYVKNPSITNGNTLEFIKINKTLAPNEEIIVNTIEGERSVTGKLDGVNYNYYKYRDANSSWMQLKVGENIITYTADEGVVYLDIFIRYTNKYLEVQECY